MVASPDPTPRNPGKAALAALALASGQSIRGTATAVGLNERTVRRWARAPTFKAKVERLRAEMTDQALGRLVGLAAGAAGVLGKLMLEADSDATRLAAAKAILDKLPIMSEYFDLLERLRVLEQREQRAEADGGQSWR